MRVLRRVAAIAGLAVTAVVLAWAPAVAGAAVAPRPSPFGPAFWTVERMTRVLAPFETSGDNPADLPDTPFQILYPDQSTAQTTPVGTGYRATGTNAFTVPAGTRFFIPAFYVDDSPPVLGTFPQSYLGGVWYFFGADQYGARLDIAIDGQSFRLGPLDISGPVMSASPLPDGASHIIMAGAFLAPLSSGVHTVSLGGGVFGAALEPTYGFSFLEQALTYTVTVKAR